MGKTLKRQRARSAQQAARIERACHRVTFDPLDPLWVKLEEELLGLVLVIVDENWDGSSPFVTTLLLDLSAVHRGGDGRIERAWKRAADAFAVLVAYADSLRFASEEERYQFWSWLGHSDIMSSLRDDEEVPDVEANRVLLCDTITIDFVWWARPFDRRVIDVIYDVMFADRAVYELMAQRAMDARPLRTSVTIFGCAVSLEDVHCLAKLLTVPQADDATSLLCEADSLVELTLSYTDIEAEVLDALAAIVENSPRRIDSIDLAGALPEYEPPEYLPSFRRLMTAMFCPTRPSHQGHGMALSLALNRVEAVHMEALQIALSQATRPLCSLSLEGLEGGSYGTCRRLGNLFFSSAGRTPSDECDLHLGKPKNLARIGATIWESLNEAVADAIPRVRQALVAKEQVACRLASVTDELDKQVAERVLATPEAFVTVIDVRPHVATEGGLFLVDITRDDSDTVAPFWVDYSTISSLKIGDEFVVRSRFTALDADEWHDGGLALMRAIGPDLHALSMHEYDSDATLGAMLHPCTQLKSLTLKKLKWPYREYKPEIDSALRSELFKSLQVLQLEDCYLRLNDLSSLRDRLAQETSPALRFLGLKGTKAKEEGLVAVRDLLRHQPLIEYVEVDRDYWASDACCWDKDLAACTNYAATRVLVDNEFRNECLSLSVKAALLSVLVPYQHFEPTTVAQIFAYAGRSTPRRLVWSPVPKPW